MKIFDRLTQKNYNSIREESFLYWLLVDVLGNIIAVAIISFIIGICIMITIPYWGKVYTENKYIMQGFCKSVELNNY